MITLLKCEKGCRREICEDESEKEFVFHNVIKHLDDSNHAKCKSCGHESVRSQEEIGNVFKGGFNGAKVQLTKYPYVEPQSGVRVNSAEDRVRAWKHLGYKPYDPKERLK